MKLNEFRHLNFILGLKMKNIFFIALSFLLISCQTDNEKFISAYDFGKDDSSSSSSSNSQESSNNTGSISSSTTSSSSSSSISNSSSGYSY